MYDWKAVSPLLHMVHNIGDKARSNDLVMSLVVVHTADPLDLPCSATRL